MAFACNVCSDKSGRIDFVPRRRGIYGTVVMLLSAILFGSRRGERKSLRHPKVRQARAGRAIHAKASAGEKANVGERQRPGGGTTLRL